MTDVDKKSGLTRRSFLAASVAGMAAVGLAGLGPLPRAWAAEPIVLPPLPYAQNALEPHLSARTVEFHYGKHHAGYVGKLNSLVQSAGFAPLALPDIIRQAAGNPRQAVIFNNAAQVWNHTFYWQSMKPGGGGDPGGELARLIQAEFKSPAGFRESFTQAAVGLFGSGWVWLVLNEDRVGIHTTSNADTPLAQGMKPLLTLDVWEHAYYLDYQNRRADYIRAFLDHLVNWEFAEKNLRA